MCLGKSLVVVDIYGSFLQSGQFSVHNGEALLNYIIIIIIINIIIIIIIIIPLSLNMILALLTL